LKVGAEALRQTLAAKRLKNDARLDTEFIDIQLLSAEPTGVNQKYKRIGALHSVPLLRKNHTLENIKGSCIQHFNVGEGKICDLLVSERGPSVRNMSQLNLKKLVHCRFIDCDTNKKPEVGAPANELKMEETEFKIQESIVTQSTQPTASVVPASVSISAYMKAGQLVATNKKIVNLELEEFDVEGKGFGRFLKLSVFQDRWIKGYMLSKNF